MHVDIKYYYAATARPTSVLQQLESTGQREAAPNRVSPPPPTLPCGALRPPSQNRPIRRAWRGSQSTLPLPLSCVGRELSAPVPFCRPPPRKPGGAPILGANSRIPWKDRPRVRLASVFAHCTLLCLQPALELIPAISVRYFDDQLITMLPRHCVVPR